MLLQMGNDDQPCIQPTPSSVSDVYQFIRTTWTEEGDPCAVDAKGRATMRPAFSGLNPLCEEQLAPVITVFRDGGVSLHRKERALP